MTSRLILILLLIAWPGHTPGLRASGQAMSFPNSVPHARVVVVENPRSIVAFNPVPEPVEEMVKLGITALTAKESPTLAWRSLVSTQDIVGIKVFSAPGPTSGTRPAVVAPIVKGLLESGMPPQQIVIWDKHLSDLRLSGFVSLAERLGVEVAGSADEGYDPKTFYETALLGNLVWGDLEFGKKGDDLGRKSFVSKLLTQRLTKIIHVTPLLNHNLAQVSGNLYSLAIASVDNSLRFEAGSGYQFGEAVPEIYALPEVGDRVVLSVVDGLICQYQGEERTLLHYSTMLGQLRFSTDPVALDVLSIHELDNQRQRAKIPPIKVNWQIYTNATLLDLGMSDPRLIDVTKLHKEQR